MTVVPVAHTLQIAIEHHRAGRLSDAERGYKEVLDTEPTNPDALHLLGLLALQRGKNDAAIELIEKALRFGGPQPVLLNNLGRAYLAVGRLGEAKRCFSKVLAIKPDSAEAHHGLAVALARTGQLKAAEQSYRRAVAIEPAFADAHHRLANLLKELGRYEEAEQGYRRALALVPDFAEARVNLGDMLHDLGRLEEAEATYRLALKSEPSLGEAHNNLGGVLRDLGRLDEAEESFRRALARMPDAPEVHFNLGNTLYDLGRLEEAEGCFERVSTLNPNHAEARFALTILRLRPSSLQDRPVEGAGKAIRDIRELRQWFELRRGADDSKAVGALQPFFLAYEEQNHRDVLHEYGKLCASLMDRWWVEHKFAPVSHALGSVIRVGIVSGHVHSHSVWHAIVKGWLRHIDRERVELQVFYTGSVQDDETLFAKSQASHFEARKSELSDWVESILDRHLDVLVYPEIGMDPMTLRLASLRLAPIQMAAWGHPMTTGLPTIDYYLSAQDFEPEDAREHYTEELVALPHLGCCFSSPPVPSASPDFAALGIEVESPLLVCPGAPFKYSARHDWIFPEIARRLVRCQFIFFALEPHYLAERLRQRLESVFAKAGLDFERHVVFIRKQPLAEFHGLMRRADVYLDTLGFSGFNTAMQAIECGLPIVTQKGRFLRGRFGSGILERMHLPDLIASSEEDYVTLAVRLAQDRDYRRRTTERIAAARSALYDDVSPVKALEEFLAKVVQRR